jgi:hypothetical protein
MTFTVRKDETEFVLLAGDESGRELARAEAKNGFEGGTRIVSKLVEISSVKTEFPRCPNGG